MVIKEVEAGNRTVLVSHPIMYALASHFAVTIPFFVTAIRGGCQGYLRKGLLDDLDATLQKYWIFSVHE